MPLVPAHEILADARTRRFGIPCLLAANLEMLIGQIRAAEATRAPMILAFNAGVTPDIDMDLMLPAIVTAARRATVPIATILDHGASLEQAMHAIELGTSSVMYDGSYLPYDENVRATAEVVRVAHTRGVSVEGELGAIGGSSIELGAGDADTSSLTDPLQARDFVARTGADVLAISFGNAHGVYRGTPYLDFSRVRAIASLVDVPLAMHGASGLPFDQYPQIVDSGISKINYYTASGRAVTRQLRSWLDDAPEEQVVMHHMISMAIELVQSETVRLLETLRCTGKAESVSSWTVSRQKG